MYLDQMLPLNSKEVRKGRGNRKHLPLRLLAGFIYDESNNTLSVASS